MTTSTPDSGRHPEGLLAAYVDGSVAGEALADIEQHLAGCASCREDVRLAEAARLRLRALPELDMPPATRRSLVHALDHETATARAPGASAGGEPGGPARKDAGRWLAGLAAAAAIVGLIAVALPRLASNESGGSTAAPANNEQAPDAAASDAGGSGPPIVERQDTDYEPADVAALADAAARAATSAAAPERAESTQPPGAARAIECVLRWASAAQGATTTRVIEASYQGRPAYLGVARQTPPGEDSERILVWVLGRDACELISFTQRRV